MKYNIVLDKNFNFVGTLCDKRDVKLFNVQRDNEYFKTYEMSGKELKAKVGTVEMLKDTEAFMSHGYLIFPEEEIFLFEGFDDMHTNFSAVLANFLRDVKPFIKFEDDDLEIVEAFLEIVYSMLEESEFLMHNSEDEPYDHDHHFRMDKLVRDTVLMFGGRK